MSMNAEELYHRIGRLIESMPERLNENRNTPEVQRWLGQADAAIHLGGNIIDGVDWRMAVGKLGDMVYGPSVPQELSQLLYRVLASAELRVPAGVGGKFIPAGGSFDAFAAISRILQSAARDVFVVDPYMDETALTEFGQAAPQGVPMRLLADAKDHKPTLGPAARKWAAQYGAARPLAVRLAPERMLHDRAIFVDGKGAWTLTQSLKDFAKRAPGEIIRADDTAPLKIAAYEAIWKTAAVVV